MWWPILIIVACAWIVPLLGAGEAGVGWPFFVGVGCLWTVLFVFIRPLYDLGIRIRRKLGMTRLADRGERVKPRILPPARVALLLMAVLSFAFVVSHAAAIRRTQAHRGGLPGDENRSRNPLRVTVLTWNIRYGRRTGRDLNSWPERAPVLMRALADASPDIFCAQEVLAGQLQEIAAAMPGHGFVAVGRADGKNAGEHCPIFFDRQRFVLVDNGTFWLTDTPDVPSRTWGNEFGRLRVGSVVPLRGINRPGKPGR